MDEDIRVVLLPLGKIIGRYIKVSEGCVIENPRQLLSQANSQTPEIIEFKIVKLFEDPSEMFIQDTTIMYNVTNPLVLRSYRESVTGIRSASADDLKNLPQIPMVRH